MEGFAGSRQLVKEDGTTAKEGETLDFKVLEFSKATKRILLSHTRIFEEVKKQEAQAEKNERRKADDAAKESVKKINASVEKTTLGDISSLAELKASYGRERSRSQTEKRSLKRPNNMNYYDVSGYHIG